MIRRQEFDGLIKRWAKSPAEHHRQCIPRYLLRSILLFVKGWFGPFALWDETSKREW